MKVNYKKDKRYKTEKYPIRQPLFFVGLIWILSKIMLVGKKHKVEKIGMEGLKPPYMILSNHMSFVDFELVALGTLPHRVNNVVNIDGYYQRPWLMELIGAICTRKFTNDMHLIKSIKKVLSRGDILCMYPEARYSPCGITSYLPESLGMLVKRCKVPVVVVTHRGNYLHAPFWNFRKKRKVPLYTTMKLCLTPEQIEKMSYNEINESLKQAFVYDDYKYQRDHGIEITEPFRAEGIHKILYKCPACESEGKITSYGDTISCGVCGKEWTLGVDSTIKATKGDTEFKYVPDWFEWERIKVREEVESGSYFFEDEVDVYSMPGCWKFEPLGKAKFTHTVENGFTIEGNYRDSDYRITRTPLEINSLHVEYDFPHIKPFDCVDISTETDSFYCFPTKENVITKMAFATEEIYRIHKEKVSRTRKKASE
jgi:1-acyl-sn-glycerol-3-phosphate acyltransferase